MPTALRLSLPPQGPRKRSNSFSMGGIGQPMETGRMTPTIVSGHHRSSSGRHSDHPPPIPSLDRRSSSSSSSSRVHFIERPGAPRRSTWSESPGSTVSSLAGPRLKIHRTISCAPGQSALVYDVISKPNHMNILSAANMAPIPPHQLNLPATMPRVAELTLVSRDLMWPIRVTSTTNPLHAVTNLDVIESIYVALHVPVSRREWEALGHNSKAQLRVTDAYGKRCAITRDWENGVRRCDFLLGRTTLIGIESKADGTHELIFSH